MSYNQYPSHYPPNFSYQQHTPGPPQPAWQQPPRRTGWFDPRLQQQQYQQLNNPSPISPAQPSGYGQSAPLPPPPPQPPSNQYPPAAGQYSFPPVAANQYDTSSWGVKYNQQQQQQQQQQQPYTPEHRPSLPARPASAVSQYSERPNQNQAPQEWHQTGPGVQAFQQPAQAQWQTSGQWQTSQDTPPPRPPRPPEYQSQAQAAHQQNVVSHEQHSQQPPSHHYEPRHGSQNIPQPPPTVPGHIAFQYAAPPGISAPPNVAADPVPVSPIHNTPPRWDNSRPSHDPDYVPSIMQAPATPGEQQFYASALGTAGAPSDWEHFGDGHTVSPEASSPPSAHALPVKHELGNFANDSLQKPMKQDNRILTLRSDDKPSTFVADGVKRTGTIDSVIQAWSTPIGQTSGPGTPQRSQSLAQAQPASSIQKQSQPQERVVEVEKVVDPYSDLEPEFRASLKRYANMLRKEASAEKDEDKFQIFQSFVNRELKLRSMLYGIEAQLQPVKVETAARKDRDGSESILTIPLPAPGDSSQSSATGMVATTNKDHETKENLAKAGSSSVATNGNAVPTSQSEKTDTDSKQLTVPLQPAGTQSSQTEQGSRDQPQPDNMTTTKGMRRPSTPPAQTGVKDPSTPDSWENFRGDNESGDEDLQYSPGGRPVLKGSSGVATEKTDTSKPKAAIASDQMASPPSPGANAPIVLSDYIMPHPPSPKPHESILTQTARRPGSSHDTKRHPADDLTEDPNNVSGQQPATPSLKFEPDRPVYTPFRYSTAAQKPAVPADESYSSLRKEAEESDRFMKHEPIISVEPPSRTSTPSVKPQDETFIGLIRQQSKAVRKKTPDLPPVPQLRPGTPAAMNFATPNQPPGQDLRVATTALRSLLPSTLPEYEALAQNPHASQLKSQVDTIPDEFSFIHATVIEWDRKNRDVRKQQDAERSSRQAESEQQIDDLFNDNEISYADIGDLEAEFKLGEAKRKYEEDQQELESFTIGVYDVVNERLQKQQSELESLFAAALDLLETKAEAASHCLTAGQDKAKMTFVLDLVMAIFDKLEVRHQKLAEANVERERRRKRLELTVLYVNGDTKGVKDLEQEFNKAEKLEVLHQAHEKDNRTNKLMDAVDKATVRGLGDNQTYVDDLLLKIKILRDIVLKDTSNIPKEVYDPEGPRDSMALAQKTIDTVLADSQKLLITSNVADKLLNDADYAVSVANAKVSDAEATTYETLAKEKEKEDAKIVEDTNSRVTSISKGPEEAISIIREVVDRVGDDTEHQDRIRKALEAAKLRNTGNVPAGETVADG